MAKEAAEAKAISIHAPLRERPQCLQANSDSEKYFNPRSLTGATYHFQLTNAQRKFQSTLPYGSDVSHPISWAGVTLFQSTLPYGSDGLCSKNGLEN